MNFLFKKIVRDDAQELKEVIEKSYVKKYGNDYERKSDFKLFHVDYYIEKGTSNIAILKTEKEIKCFAIYKEISEEQILEDFESVLNEYSEVEINGINRYISDISKNGIYIEYMESFESGCGTVMIDKLKSLHKNIILYADIDACGFWDKMNFKNIFGYNYMYESK